jgi:sugar lactone lactonase YvrE
MKSTLLGFLLLILSISLNACSPAANNETPAKQAAPAPAPGATPASPAAATDAAKWTITDGIDAPESVYVDSETGDIYTSQIGGMPDKKDGNGHIMKLGPDGKVVSASWATGLNAPKGLRSAKGTLWTADLDEVVGIDMKTGKATSHIKIPDAKFLNDVATGPDGTVYVTDTFASRIYAINNGKLSTFADGDDLEYPNGILVEGDHLVVGGWGKPEVDFSTKVPGRLFTIDLKTKKKTLITPEPFANIDGLESDGNGGYIVSDYNAGKLYQISGRGEIHQIKQFMPGVADIGFVPAQNLIIVPHMNENKVAAYDISTELNGSPTR